MRQVFCCMNHLGKGTICYVSSGCYLLQRCNERVKINGVYNVECSANNEDGGCCHA